MTAVNQTPPEFQLNLRAFHLAQNENGYNHWLEKTTIQRVPASRCAVVICDMWDNHWSRGAAERVNAMAPRMNEVVSAARAKGAHIIHAPSNTLEFYAQHPARQRMLEVPTVAPPPSRERAAPPLPIDDSDEGSDTGETHAARVWTRQHPALVIDPACDTISDQGAEVYSYLQHHGIRQMLIMGVHTNMCVLNRSFAIKQMVRWGVAVALVRDLTDAMYNPAMSPYVSHAAGTELVVGYIEKFWCPSVSSHDLIG